MSSAPPPPPAAEDIFGDRLPLAVRYAALLCGPGVERGLLGPREPERVWERHLLNSAALAAEIPHAADVLDLGSGAGLPGVPLALARPDARLRLVEPMERRVRFLLEVVAELALDVRIDRLRAEELPERCTDVAVARAVAPFPRLARLTLPLLRPGGRLLALKGRSAAAELVEAAPVLAEWPHARASVGTVKLAGVGAQVIQVDLGEQPRSRRQGTAVAR